MIKYRFLNLVHVFGSTHYEYYKMKLLNLMYTRMLS